MLMVTALIWGTAFVAQKSGMDLISPIAFNGIRTLVGAFALIPVIMVICAVAFALPSLGDICGEPSGRCTQASPDLTNESLRSVPMAVTHKIGISSFAYCFACGSRPFTKPQHIMTPHDLIDRAAALGVDVVQFGDNMPLEVYSDEELKQIRSHAEKCGVELEAGMRKATPERLSEYIRITHIIGGRVLRVITDGIGFTPDMNEFCRISASVTRQIEECGVVLGIENHDRFSAREYAQMVETIDHPQVGLTVDTVNSLSHEEHIDEVLKYMAPYCVCLHMKDYVIKRYNGGGGLRITGASPGTGRLDIRRCYEECRNKSNKSFNIILESWMEPCETLEETLRTEDEWAGAGVSYLKTIL